MPIPSSPCSSAIPVIVALAAVVVANPKPSSMTLNTNSGYSGRISSSSAGSPSFGIGL